MKLILSQLILSQLLLLIYCQSQYAIGSEISIENKKYEYIEGAKKHPIAFKALTNKKFKKSLVIVHGTGESLVRYYQIANHFHKAGFNVYIYDQRGHGYSGRFDSNRVKIMTDGYANQVKDLSYMVNTAVDGLSDNKVYLLGHSMGGLIGLRYLELYPDTIEKAVISSPMLRINLPIPEAAAIFLADAFAFFGKENHWVIGENPKNMINATHLDIRETHNKQLSDDYKKRIFNDKHNLKTWGVTYSWLKEAISYGRLTRSDSEINKIKTKTLILTASEDFFVDIKEQKSFCSKLKNCKQEVYTGSWHSILQEVDQHRLKALNDIEKFFKN